MVGGQAQRSPFVIVELREKANRGNSDQEMTVEEELWTVIESVNNTFFPEIRISMDSIIIVDLAKLLQKLGKDTEPTSHHGGLRGGNRESLSGFWETNG
jgi:hypothetical protein